MKSSLDYVRWSREQARERGLTRGQAQILNQLSTYVNGRGECYPDVATLAVGAVLSKRHTERVLNELGELRIVETTRRGRGRAARRRLCPDAPLPAPPCPRGTQPLFDAAFQPAVEPAPARSADPPSVTPDPPSEWRTPVHVGAGKDQCEETEEGTRAARAATTDQPVQEKSRALQEHLDEVLAIVEAAPGLLVEPLAVDSALAAYPEPAGHDHLRAAHTVASWAFEADGVRVGTANRLLMAALRKQTLPARAAAAGPPRPHDGRRRRETPVVCDAVRRGDEAIARMLAAKGIRI